MCVTALGMCDLSRWHCPWMPVGLNQLNQICQTHPTQLNFLYKTEAPASLGWGFLFGLSYDQLLYFANHRIKFWSFLMGGCFNSLLLIFHHQYILADEAVEEALG